MSEEIKEARASLTIEMWVDCPNEECTAYINLSDERDTDGMCLDDDNQLLRQAVPDGHWSEEHEKFECEEVICTECKVPFRVKGLDW